MVGLPNCRLALKLKQLKSDLKWWNVEVFGWLEAQKADTLSVIQELDGKEAEGGLSEADLVRRDGARKEYGHIAHMEEISFRQKSRCLWLKDGDHNTKFFHQMANAHRRSNQIGKMCVNRVILSSEEEVSSGIVGFYQHLFRDGGEMWRPGIDGVTFDTISEADGQMMKRPFTEEEVLGVLRSMLGDKEPRPDAFSIAFFQQCWRVVKTDVMALFEQFYQTGQFENSLNATFIALIPKKEGEEDISRFSAD